MADKCFIDYKGTSTLRVPYDQTKLNQNEKRRTSFSMAFSWRTRLKTVNDAAAIAGVVNLDLALTLIF